MGNLNTETAKFVGQTIVHLSVFSHVVGRNYVKKMG